MTDYGQHYSVMLGECLEYLPDFNQDDIFVDGTFGGGGHSIAIAQKFPNIKIIGVDQDISAIENGNKRITELKLNNQISLYHGNFSTFSSWFLENNPNRKIKGILVDLGVSSHQFDTPERGFSFRYDADLDMRMDQTHSTLTAGEVLNTFSEEDIANIIFEFGEERASRIIAKNIIEFRGQQEIKTTKQLEDIVFHSYSKKFRFGRIHPATKTFQALRIYVNQELTVLKDSLPAFWELLDTNGRILAISFHSLEDRIVKHKFKEIFHNDKKAAKILTKRPIMASEQELEQNARSRSAKLRVIEKI